MARRVVIQSQFARVTRPGYDVFDTPYGGAGVAFDSRETEAGIAWLTGTCTAGQAVYFPYTPVYTPMLRFWSLSGQTTWEGDVYYCYNGAGSITNMTTPWIGIVYSDHFVITKLVNGIYDFSPSGGAFMFMLMRGRA